MDTYVTFLLEPVLPGAQPKEIFIEKLLKKLMKILSKHGYSTVIIVEHRITINEQ